MKKALLAVLLVISVIASVQADVYLKQKVTQSGMPGMGQAGPGGTEIHEIWISHDRIRTDMGTQTTIIDLKKSRIVMINHPEKSYSEMPMNLSEAFAGQLGSGDDGDAAGMQEMMQAMMKMEMTVQPMDEKKNIGTWNCRKYIQTLKMAMGTITTEVWATEDIRIDPALYQKFTTAMMARQPGMAGSLEAIQEEQKKIKGVPVLQKASGQMMGMQFEMTTELLEAKDSTAPENLFAVPDGYRKKFYLEND
ncbi:MAG TPA: DUF4412 domain-containing protein [bacterium]|nr:DUF4412 domain-containing protein [bacterium]